MKYALHKIENTILFARPHPTPLKLGGGRGKAVAYFETF
jgi:hypothetical protein